VRRVQETKTRIRNNKLQFVNEVYLEENDGSILLTVERRDESKYSVVLRDPAAVPYVNEVIIDDKTINTVRSSLTIWGDKINQFAEQYLKDDRKEIELFNDIVTLAKCLSSLPDECLSLLKLSGATDLLHNRVMAQVMEKYHGLGFDVKLVSNKHTGRKKYDFDALGYNTLYKCEVKTVQSIGELEHISSGGYRLTDASYKSVVSAIRDDLEDARKGGKTDIIAIAPWSYRINALLRVYFKKDFMFLPTPSSNLTILVLPSDHVFEDYYVSFPTDSAQLILENTFTYIQKNGVIPLTQVPIREGLTIQTSTAPRAGSRAGYSFSLPK
jgi:hypothetical protein